MCECEPWMICIMFLRRSADEGGKKGPVSGPRGFFPRKTQKPYSAGPSTSGTTVVIYRLSGESTKLIRDRRPNSTKNFYVTLNLTTLQRTSLNTALTENGFQFFFFFLRRFTVSRSSFRFLLQQFLIRIQITITISARKQILSSSNESFLPLI